MKVSGSKIALSQGSLNYDIEIPRKILKRLLLQNNSAQMLETWDVSLPRYPLPSLFKWKSKGSKWPRPGVSYVWTIQIHRKILKILLLQNLFPQMLEICYVALSSGPLPICSKWYFPSGPGFASKIYLKIFFSRTAKLSCLKICYVALPCGP